MSAQNFTDSNSMLRIGTTLRGIYRIDKYLSSGGFGKTYVGYNTEFGEQIAIKEFFLKGVAQRDSDQTSVSISSTDNVDIFNEQKEKFKKEARRLRKLKNEHLVGVHDLFEENGTAYYVMDLVDGENLRERLERTGQPLTEEEVWKILPQILDALKYVHDVGLWHLDLKPGNIMVDKNGVAKLIDFGASKQFDKQKGGATAHTSVTFTNGYAPREQMEKNYEKFGPWTDIYALGATLYALLTNSRPPMPSDIDDDDSEDKHEALPLPQGTSKKMRDTIIKMMNTNRNRRPQSIDEVMALLNINSSKEEQPEQDTSTDHEETEFVNSSDTDKEETEFVKPNENKQEETVFTGAGGSVQDEAKQYYQSQGYGVDNSNNRIEADECVNAAFKVFGIDLNSKWLMQCVMATSFITAICAFHLIIYYTNDFLNTCKGTWTYLGDTFYDVLKFSFIGKQVGIALLLALFGFHINKLEIREAKLLFLTSCLEIITIILFFSEGGYLYLLIWYSLYMFLVVCGGNLLIKYTEIPRLYGISLIGIGLFGAISDLKYVLYFIFDMGDLIPYVVVPPFKVLNIIWSLLFIWAMNKKIKSIIAVI